MVVIEAGGKTGPTEPLSPWGSDASCGPMDVTGHPLTTRTSQLDVTGSFTMVSECRGHRDLRSSDPGPAARKGIGDEPARLADRSGAARCHPGIGDRARRGRACVPRASAVTVGRGVEHPSGFGPRPPRSRRWSLWRHQTCRLARWCPRAAQRSGPRKSWRSPRPRRPASRLERPTQRCLRPGPCSTAGSTSSPATSRSRSSNLPSPRSVLQPRSRARTTAPQRRGGEPRPLRPRLVQLPAC